jgi:hypothetical protein
MLPSHGNVTFVRVYLLVNSSDLSEPADLVFSITQHPHSYPQWLELT